MNRVTIILIFGLLVGNHCTGQTSTWTKDIAPIIYENCASCHHESAIAPFELMSYDDCKSYGYNIRSVVNERSMPPWPADPDYKHFVGEASLSQEEIDAINQWVIDDFPFGDANEEPQPPVFLEEGSLLNSIDYVVEIEPYTIQTNDDEYRWFVIDNPFEEIVYISKIEVMVGLPDVVHHADLFLDYSDQSANFDAEDPMPGFNSSTGFPNSDYYINAWQPGGNIANYPRGWGITLDPGASFVIEIHYGPGAIGQIDSTKMNLEFVKDVENPRAIGTAWLLQDSAPILVDGPLVIPANQTKTFHQERTLNYDYSMIAICPHMHLLGSSYKVWYETPEGDSVNLINIPKWDFHWQKYYTFETIQKVPAGATIKSEGTFDNTINNHDNPNLPPIEVAKGLNTSDEMFLCYFIFSAYEEGDEYISLYPELISKVKNHEKPIQFELSPNPAGDFLYIDVGEFSGDTSLKIFNAQGKLVYRVSHYLSLERLDIGFLKGGVYFLEASDRASSGVQKFIKID